MFNPEMGSPTPEQTGIDMNDATSRWARGENVSNHEEIAILSERVNFLRNQLKAAESDPQRRDDAGIEGLRKTLADNEQWLKEAEGKRKPN